MATRLMNGPDWVAVPATAEPADRQAPALVTARLRAALDMFDFGAEIERAQLQRQRPNASRAEIDEALRRWLVAEPHTGGAEVTGVFATSAPKPRPPPKPAQQSRHRAGRNKTGEGKRSTP